MSHLQILRNQECPECKRKKLRREIHNRVNYPYGKTRNKPRLTKKLEIDKCTCGYENTKKW